MREQFSKIGYVLAMAGSAVGLGNAWKFPTMVGTSGGSAFIVLYLVLTLLVAFVVFLGELSIGKITRKDPVAAFSTLAPRHKRAWGMAGFFMIGAILIVCFYSVVIGWILRYIFMSFTGLPGDISRSSEVFSSLINHDLAVQIPCFSAVFALIFFVLSRGVKSGIERLNVFMMPALFVLLILMLFYSFSIDGFSQAFWFLFKPDFSAITYHSVLDALGLSFFSLSMGVCVVLTYATSLPDSTHIIRSTLSIIAINVLIGLMMGLVVFSFVFEFGADPSQSGAGLVFVSLASLFGGMGIIGQVVGVLFFVALFFAGVTSAVSMVEPFAFYLMSRFGLSRAKALVLIGCFVYVVGLLCIFGNHADYADYLMIFGRSLFDSLDFATSNLLMPIFAIITCIFVGFIAPQSTIKEFFVPYMGSGGFLVWRFFIRFICPLAIVDIMLGGWLSSKLLMLLSFS